MPTLTEIHNKQSLLADYLGVEYKSEREEELLREIEVLENKLAILCGELETLDDDGMPTGDFEYHGYKELSRSEVVKAAYTKLTLVSNSEQSHNSYVRECAREALGIKGKSVEEVRQKCIKMYPYMYCLPDGEFAPYPEVCDEPTN